MHNLFRMSSLASLILFMQNGRIDRELLNSTRRFVATTRCRQEVQTRYALATKPSTLQQSSATFCKNFYVEIMQHDLEIRRRIFKDLIQLSKILRCHW